MFGWLDHACNHRQHWRECRDDRRVIAAVGIDAEPQVLAAFGAAVTR